MQRIEIMVLRVRRRRIKKMESKAKYKANYKSDPDLTGLGLCKYAEYYYTHIVILFECGYKGECKHRVMEGSNHDWPVCDREKETRWLDDYLKDEGSTEDHRGCEINEDALNAD